MSRDSLNINVFGEETYFNDDVTFFKNVNIGGNVTATSFIKSGGTDGVLTGTIHMWGGSTAPTGYLECNGQSTSGYTALSAVVGDNVPDLRGEFVRGWDNGRGVDTGRNILTTQSDEFKSHTHPGSSLVKFTGGVTISPGSSNSFDSQSSVASDGGIETRPRNVALMYIIKT
tara:strand:- start:588 stop:1103 length:516 start_codon:yes stop_codon:yes gene_type:complete